MLRHLFALGALVLVAPTPADPVPAQIASILASGSNPAMRYGNLADVRADLARLYDENGGEPLWLQGARPSPAALAFVARLDTAQAWGLDPADYDVALFDSVRTAPGVATVQAARYDVALSTAMLRFLRALRWGRVTADQAYANLRMPQGSYDADRAIAALQRGAPTDSVIAAAEPHLVHYQLLKAQLAGYRRKTADAPHLPPVTGTLRPGAVYPDAATLRAILVLTGDLGDSIAAPSPSADTLYDGALVDAMKRFQRRQGLGADGVIGSTSAARLADPFPARIRQIELTLERFRWIPREFSAPPIIVNIPAFRLYAFRSASDRESDLLAMNVVVGRAYKHETPVFAADMTYLVFSPSWDVPRSIMLAETRPAALKNPAYLERNNMELLRGGTVVPATPENIAAIGGAVRVRQKPGEGNALGRVKFMLPNDHAVYLHDTPSTGLFSKDRRDFSHGCIRVAEPAVLADHVLRGDTTWTKARIEQAMSKGTSTTVRLAQPIPVLILYATAMTREGGELLFYDDIYGHDKTLDRMIRTKYPYPH